MVNWDVLLYTLIYPLALLGPLLDGVSTVLLLENIESATERNSRVMFFQRRFGLRKGQAIFSTIAIALWLGGVHMLLITAGLAITCLAVGLFLGFALKQLYDGYCAYSASNSQ